MHEELTMNAYVLVGNALHRSVQRRSGVPCAVSALHGRLLPLTPGELLAAVLALPAEELAEVAGSIRECLADGAAEELLGLPREACEQTLAELLALHRDASG